VTRLALAAITGHSMDTVQKILDARYLGGRWPRQRSGNSTRLTVRIMNRLDKPDDKPVNPFCIENTASP
jgi:hypothetical protein